jgi:hypothetical protein
VKGDEEQMVHKTHSHFHPMPGGTGEDGPPRDPYDRARNGGSSRSCSVATLGYHENFTYSADIAAKPVL